MRQIKYIIAFLIVLCITSLKAQNISLNVDNHPTPEIAQWVDRQDLAILTVSNSNPQLVETEYIIKVKMFLDGDLVLETNNGVDVQTFDLGVQTFLADEIIPYNAIDFNSNSFRNKVLQTGMLPAGEYMFCCSLLNLEGETISIPEAICQPMIITDYQMPELIYPINNELITEQMAPTLQFTWSPMTPTPEYPDGVKYIIALSIVQNGQSPSQAFHVNYPIIEEEVLNAPFLWPTDLEMPDETTQYVWSVKPVSLEDNPYKADDNGFVPFETFTIEAQEEDESLGGLECDCNNEELEEPPVTIFRPDPVNNPYYIGMTGIQALELYSIACDENKSISDYTALARINWDELHTDDVPSNHSLAEHVYSPMLPEGLHNIPEEIEVVVQVVHNSTGVKCLKSYSYEVPDSIRQSVNVAGAYTEGNIAETDTIYAGNNGEFEVLAHNVVPHGDKFSGQGSVFVNWLNARLDVEFDSISVDGNKHLNFGKITTKIHDTAPTYPQDWAMEAVAQTPWANNIAGNVVQWVENNFNQQIPYNNLTELTTPVKVPLGLNFPSGDQIAITEMAFFPADSKMNVVMAKMTPPSWGTPQRIGFEASEIAFHPTDIDLSEGKIELVEDVAIGNPAGDMVFIFKEPTPSNSGCYAEWSESGIDEYGIQLDTEFTRDWLIPVPDDGVSKSRATLSAVGTEWNDMVLTGTLLKSELVSSEGMTVLADSITYDMSDVLNAPSINFPENYSGETSNLFRGFYMKEASVEMPEGWETSTGRAKFSIQDMIIDNMGVTLYAEATNIAEWKTAEVADLVASIDTIHVDIVANSLTEAGVKGRLGLPVSKPDSIQNPLNYAALFHHAQSPGQENYFQLTVEPSGPINAHLLKGKMTLDNTSNIVAYVDKNKRTFQSTLNGEFNWDDIQLGPIKQVDMQLDFQGVEMNYNSSQPTNKFQFDAGSWAFASPQKFLANFPVTIDNIDYTNMSTTGNQLMNGKLNFDVIFNLSQNIGGLTTLGVKASIEDQSATGGKKFYPSFDGISLDSIAIHAHLPAVKIDGAIGFRNDHPVFGNGFIGTLSADFKPVNIKASATAEFGNTNYQHNALYRYWRVQANATIPPPGVPFLPGVAFRGFGGGAFKNMEVTGSSPNYTFGPKKSSLGFIANAILATTPKEETFNADVGLLGQFSGSGGLTYIAFDGDFYVGAGFNSRNKAKVNGNVNVSYDFPQKHFNMSAQVNVNAPPITTPYPADLVLDINGKTNNWYFKFGEPQQSPSDNSSLNTINIGGVQLYEYLMFGNDIPYPNGFSYKFRDKYHTKIGSYPYSGNVGSGGVGSNTQTGKGFALGIGFEFDKSGDIVLTRRKNGNTKHAVHYDLAAGAELNLSYMQYVGSCGGYAPLGINGYRAKGGLGMYGVAAASVRKYKKNGSVDWNRTVAAIKAGAWIIGEFPNPNYAAGAIDGSVNLLDLIHFDFNLDFESGTKCPNGGASSGAPVTQGDAAADQQQLLIQYIHPAQSSYFPVTAPLAVKYGLIPDEVFDVSEQQANGTIENRTFKMVVERSLKNNGNAIMLSTSENNLGEYLYTILQPLNLTAQAYVASRGGFLPVSNNGVTPAQQATQSVQSTFNMPVGSMNTPVAQIGRQNQLANLVTYPPTSGSNQYENLPPEPDPVINTLEADKNYVFTVTATLKELINGNWVTAQKNNGDPVTQTVTKNFRTGAPQLAQTSTSTR